MAMKKRRPEQYKKIWETRRRNGTGKHSEETKKKMRMNPHFFKKGMIPWNMEENMDYLFII